MEREGFTLTSTVRPSTTIFPLSYQWSPGKYINLVAYTPTMAIYTFQTSRVINRRSTLPPSTFAPDFSAPAIIPIPSSPTSSLSLENTFTSMYFYPINCGTATSTIHFKTIHCVYNLVQNSSFATTTTAIPSVRMRE